MLALMIIKALGWMKDIFLSSFEVMGSASLCLHTSIDQVVRQWYATIDVLTLIVFSITCMKSQDTVTS